MEICNEQTIKEDFQSRRQFINKASLLLGGALFGCITLLGACDVMEITKTETITHSRTFTFNLPDKISGIENLPEVKAAVRSEIEPLNSFSNELAQFQLEVRELDSILSQLDNMGGLSEEMSLRLQMAMDRRSKFIQTLSQMMKRISTTQDVLVQNIK